MFVVMLSFYMSFFFNLSQLPAAFGFRDLVGVGIGAFSKKTSCYVDTFILEMRLLLLLLQKSYPPITIGLYCLHAQQALCIKRMQFSHHL